LEVVGDELGVVSLKVMFWHFLEGLRKITKIMVEVWTGYILKAR
jgi:hypothetical protein